MAPELIEVMTQFGAAGLIGVLWVIERSLSRRRDRQLDAAHHALVEQDRQVAVLTDLVRRNTAAFERLSVQQERLARVMERMRETLPCRAA